jgi:hypothetical protein
LRAVEADAVTVEDALKSVDRLRELARRVFPDGHRRPIDRTHITTLLDAGELEALLRRDFHERAT